MLQALEKYIVESNKEASKGRFDIMLTPINSCNKVEGSKKNVVIELEVGSKEKLKELSKKILKQIEDKKYYNSLKEKGVNRARILGIAFNKKEAEVSLKEIDFK